MRQILKELRYAARALSRSPGFTAVALLVLAVGIGANTAVFTVVYNVLLKPLNYRDSGRLVVVLTRGDNPVSPADYLDYKSQTTALDHMAAAQVWGGAIQRQDHSEMVPGMQVSAGLLTMLGIPPERGRLFRSGEDQPGAPPVIVISHKLWQEQFGADPNIIGSSVTIEAHPYTVVGVMPPSFQFAPFWATQTQMWTPFNMSDRRNDRAGRSIRVFARLKDGVTIDQARAQLTTIGKRLERLYPPTNAGVTIEVTRLQEEVTGPIRPTLFVLLATAALVLLIACANIANLLLTRAIGRRREIAVRLAIGAGRWDLIRQLATESLLVSITGGIAGVVLAWWSLALLSRMLPAASLPRQGEIAMEPLVLGFALLASILTGLVCGVFPAVESSGIDVNEHLKQGSRGSVGVPQRRARGLLIAAEVSLALVLLVCAGLMIRTLEQLNAVDPGFNPHNLLTMYVFAPPDEATGPRRLTFFDRVSRALAGVPGIERVSGINHLPISGDVWTFDYSVPGRAAPAPGQQPSAVYRVVRPDYFETMQIPLVQGRGFTARDNAQSQPVVVITERLARHQWPGKNPVGEMLVVPNIPWAEPRAVESPNRFTIVGVSANVQQDWASEPSEEFYLPQLQHADAWDQTHIAFVIRTAADPKSILSNAEAGVRAVDLNLTISELMPMEQVIGDKLWRSRICATLLGAFASIALVLAAIGIYGVIAYSVRQRRQEVGIRMALGADRRSVMTMVLRESMGFVFAGIGVGVALAVAAVHWLTSLLYGVQPRDPLTFALVVTGLIGVACAATLIPTWRAVRMDLSSVFRDE
jgi:predicted permease